MDRSMLLHLGLLAAFTISFACNTTHAQIQKAKIVFFAEPDFGGKAYTLTAPYDLNLSNNLMPEIRSAIVIEGNWALFESSRFTGKSFVLQKTSGPSRDGCLADLVDEIQFSPHSVKLLKLPGDKPYSQAKHPESESYQSTIESNGTIPMPEPLPKTNQWKPSKGKKATPPKATSRGWKPTGPFAPGPTKTKRLNNTGNGLPIKNRIADKIEFLNGDYWQTGKVSEMKDQSFDFFPLQIKGQKTTGSETIKSGTVQPVEFEAEKEKSKTNLPKEKLKESFPAPITLPEGNTGYNGQTNRVFSFYMSYLR